jgi:hypothetical protein
VRRTTAANQSAGKRFSFLDGMAGLTDAGRDSAPHRGGFTQAGCSVNANADLDEYFREAESWDADRVEQSRRSARLAGWVAAAGWTCAVACAAALMLLMPLKRVEPFVVRVDNATGIVDVVPIYEGRATPQEAVTPPRRATTRSAARFIRRRAIRFGMPSGRPPIQPPRSTCIRTEARSEPR